MSQHSMKKFGFTLIELLVVISIIALLLGILVPVLGIAKKNANIMKESVNVRNVHLAFTNFGSTNKDWFPGLSSSGKYGTADFTGEYYFAEETGTSVAHRDTGSSRTVVDNNSVALATVMEDSQVTPAQLISPGESGANTGATPLAMVPVTPDATAGTAATATAGLVGNLNCSYSLLQYSVPKLKAEWKSNQNQQAAVVGARLVFQDGVATFAGSVFSSIWTDSGSGKYKGAVVRGDNSSTVEVFDKNTVVSATDSPFANLKYGGTVISPTLNAAAAVGVFGASAVGGATTVTASAFNASNTLGQIGSGAN